MSPAFEKRHSDGTEVAGTSNSRAKAVTPGNQIWFFAHQSSRQLFLSIVSASIYSRISCLRACCASSRDVVGEHVSLMRSRLSKIDFLAGVTMADEVDGDRLGGVGCVSDELVAAAIIMSTVRSMTLFR